VTEITFFVPGVPAPGGSKRAFYIPKLNRAVVVETCKRTKPWRTSVEWAAKEKFTEPLRGPLSVSYCFYLSRPKGHYGSGRNSHSVKISSPVYPAVKPDVTKLIRSTEDAMTGIAWIDDAQCVEQVGKKVYSINGESGVLITIKSLNGDGNGSSESSSQTHQRRIAYPEQ
jgi:Holliday junction resolvase RusA-like endonuclease